MTMQVDGTTARSAVQQNKCGVILEEAHLLTHQPAMALIVTVVRLGHDLQEYHVEMCRVRQKLIHRTSPGRLRTCHAFRQDVTVT